MTKGVTANQVAEVKKWWTAVENANKNHQPVDVERFADAAFKYVPLLLTEIERLQKEKR